MEETPPESRMHHQQIEEQTTGQMITPAIKVDQASCGAGEDEVDGGGGGEKEVDGGTGTGTGEGGEKELGESTEVLQPMTSTPANKKTGGPGMI